MPVLFKCKIFGIYDTVAMHLHIMTSHEMGRHYVFMLILEFFDLCKNFYRSGRVTMSTLWIRGCPSDCCQIKWASTKKLQVNFRDLYILELSRMWRKKLWRKHLKFWIWNKKILAKNRYSKEGLKLKKLPTNFLKYCIFR